jgi:ATP-binding cassette subfamily C exporter for protease/lipase
MTRNQQKIDNEILLALKEYKKIFWSVGVFTFIINLLYLTPSIYMMQVYDRVLNSRNEFTLIVISLLALGLYGLMGFIEYIRSLILIRISNSIDEKLSKRIFTATFESNLTNKSSNSSQALADLNSIRQFVTGNGLFAFMDAPWLPLDLLVIFLMHPWLGWFAVIGAVILVALTVLTEKTTSSTLGLANQFGQQANNYAQSHLKNAEVIEAMGMVGPLIDRWYKLQAKMLELQSIASERASILGGVTKIFRMILQSGSLAIGVILVIEGKATGGIMIAASILIGRALAPIEMMIGSWKSFVSARSSYERLTKLLENFPVRATRMSLPHPSGQMKLENVYAVPPGQKTPILKGISFAIAAGEVVGIIGPSGSGKSTLARLLVGVWPPHGGNVRLDGSDLHMWNRSELGPYIGYLPQDIELFGGTVAENIARFGTVETEKIVNAAQLAGVHDMILQLPQGYNTPIGESGGFLSGGQRQRVALARALYGNPALIVLDEPNSNLDDVGEIALIKAVQQLKQLGKTVILITHRPGILQVVDKLLYLVEKG